jgi:hypothetical protein
MHRLLHLVSHPSRAVRLAASLALLAVAASPVPARAQAPDLTPELQKVRAALEKYQDPVVAVHDGYFSTLGCVHFPAAGGAGRMAYPAGGMGVHFLNPGLIGPGPLDPLKPQILVYEPDGDKLRLVGAEWFVPLGTGITGRPELFGRPFDGPMEGHHPLMPSALHHYDLHVWLFKVNPAGLFSPTNPAVQCGGGGYSMAEEAPRLVPHP